MPEESGDLFEIIATTRSMRRLKPDPVPPELIRTILEAGTAAPSGGNMQRWRFLVVTDPNVKQAVGTYYKRAWDEVVYPRYSAGDPAPGTSPDRFRRMLDAVGFPVIELVRISFGSVSLGTLASGKSRKLTPEEVGRLLAAAGL